MDEGSAALVGKQYGRVYAWDPVNAPMIRQWCEMMGIDNPAYTDAGLAAAASRGGLVPHRRHDAAGPGARGPSSTTTRPGSTTENPYEALKLIEAQGCRRWWRSTPDLEFERELHLAKKLYYTTQLDSIGEEKTTALGTGFFVTLVMEYFARARWRREGRPAAVPASSSSSPRMPGQAFRRRRRGDPQDPRPGPGISDDTRFFWEGAAQAAADPALQICGTLRHPPGPVCSGCHSFEWDTLRGQRPGHRLLFVVMHHPRGTAVRLPRTRWRWSSSTRARAWWRSWSAWPGDIAIGQRVKVEFATFETGEGGDIALPQFRSGDRWPG